jgi:hypothetical protein
MSLSTPVVFLIFNRPALTEIVFKEIAKAKPKKLFVIADGPRFPEEVEKCEQTRSIVNNIDWECELLTDFSEVNLGCCKRGASGFDWVFSQVEEAIFLEDDTVPAPSFFHFCETLLEYYRDDERIMHIGSNNFQFGQNKTKSSYYFSKYMHSWGWATWRRARKHYDFYMKSWPDFKEDMFKFVCEDLYERKYWENIFDQMHKDPQILNSYDYQWLYACWNQSGLSITPSVNLVSNIGFGSDATHTVNETIQAYVPTSDIWDIKHPPFVVAHRDADQYTFDHVFGGEKMREADKLPAKIRRRLSSIKRKVLS